MNEVAPGPARVGGSTRLVGVIGWPIEHSLSPAIHNAAFESLEMDWIDVPLAVAPGRLAEAIAGLDALGFVGANVTMPHKTECADLVEDLSEDARRLRAVNTLVLSGGGTVGHNTDAPGFERFLREDAAFDATGRRALIVGAGGAARACALALARSGLEELSVAVREPSRADPLLEGVDGLATTVTVVTSDEAEHVRADLVVNATPLGAHGESLSIPSVGPGSVVVDLLYRPSETPLLRDARAAGAATFGGLGLLLHQAALSFELWTGRAAPLPAMSAAALAALAEGGRWTEEPGPSGP